MIKNLKVGVQVGLVFAVGLALFIAVAAVTLVALRGIADTAGQVDQATGAREAASDVLLQMVNQETGIRGYIATGDPSFLGIVDRSRLHVQADLPALHIHAQSADEIAAAAKVQESVDGVNKFFAEQLALARSGKRAEALKHFSDENADFVKLRRAVGQLAAFAEIRTNDASNAQDDSEWVLLQILVAATAVAMVLFAAMAMLLGGRIGKRLRRVSDALDAITHEDFNNFAVALSIVADGDLSADFHFSREPIAVDGHDEIGQLAEAYNQLVVAMGDLERGFADTTERLRSALRGVLETSNDLSTASVGMSEQTHTSAEAVDRVSRAFNEVAQGAGDQAYRLIAASTAAEELSRTAEQIAEGAVEQSTAARAAADSVYRLDEQIAALASLGERLAQATRDAIDQAAAGGSAVTRTTDALSALRSVNADTVTAMTTLESRTQAVSEILGTIDEIADQTNLLALNAAIEAARAGEHGRGFAVVADEVRKLAERATGATREIGDILNAIRKEALLAMQALRSSTSRLEEGVEVAAHGNEAIERIAGAVRETAHVAGEVAQRSANMRRESSSITDNIGSVSSIVEQNAAAATEMQKTTNHLSEELTPVAVAAEEQSRTAEAVSSAATQLAQQMQEMRSFAQHVRERSTQLHSLADRFAVGQHELLMPPEMQALPTKTAV